MAESIHFQSAHLSSVDDITSCNKCHQLLNNPKTLPCLHSYCASCLEEKVTASKTKSVECLVCSKECDLPANGIEGLQPLAIVVRLAERKATQTRLMTGELISCTACDESIAHDNTDTTSVAPNAVARCTECEDYLCKRCVAIHRSQRALKGHQVLTLHELRSGEVSSSGSNEKMICPKHKGEALLFYCETCDVPICRQCVVVAHRHPDHKQAELEEAAKERLDTLRNLMSACEKNKNEVGKAIDEISKVKRDNSLAVSEAKALIEDTVQKAKASFLKRLEEARKIAEGELNEVEKVQRETMKTTEDQLISVRSRVSTAMMISQSLIDNGSDYEIASAYSNLKITLQDLSSVKIGSRNMKIKEATFEPNTDIFPEKISIGRVRHVRGGKLRPREMKATATLHKEFRIAGTTNFAYNMCYTSAGEVAVTNVWDGKVNVFAKEGTLQRTFNVNTGVDTGGSTQPRCIRVGPNGLYYVTDYQSPYVRIFDMQGTYTRSFHTVSPDNVSYSTSGSSNVCGLCFDSKDQVLAGNITHNFISRHAMDGTHISSIKVNLQPWFIAVTSRDDIIISPSGTNNKDIQIIDGTGNILHNVTKPDHVASWYPTGVIAGKIYCCNDNEEEELFIADYENGHAVYRYTVSGKYVDNCVTNALSSVFGLALSEDEEQLYVADTTSVKCFAI